MQNFPLAPAHSPHTFLALGAIELLIALSIVTALMLGVGRTVLGDGAILVALAVVPLCVLGVLHWNAGLTAQRDEAEFQADLHRETLFRE